jgi:hypothetical protein
MAHLLKLVDAAPFHAQQRVQSAPDGQVLDLCTLLPRVELQQVLAPQPLGLSVQVQQVVRKWLLNHLIRCMHPLLLKINFLRYHASPHHFFL